MSIGDNWYVSDLHLTHENVDMDGNKRGIIHFERTKFKTIEEHDDYIHERLLGWAEKHIGSTLWVLGDYGDIRKLYYMQEIRSYGITVNFIMGNHDRKCYLDLYKQYFDNVYEHPIYLNDRVILSHEPQYPLPTGCINVHGHLHGAVLEDKHYKNVSIAEIGYQPISDKVVSKMLGSVPKASYKFLREPYRGLYRFTQPKEDVVYSQTGRIKLKESIAKFNKINGTRIQ